MLDGWSPESGRPAADDGGEHGGKAGRRGVAQLPPPRSPNPYAELLYGALADLGWHRAPFPGLTLRALWQFRRRVGVLHFHWRPDLSYAPCLAKGARGRRRRLQAALQLCRFPFLLAWARLLGYRIVWTVHEIWPARHAWVDRAGHTLLAKASSVLMAHDSAVADRLRAELERPLPIEIVPHGTFEGVYAVNRPPEDVRSELGIPAKAFVFLCFGQVRSDKDVPLLLDAFGALGVPDAYLVVVGAPHHGPSCRRVKAAVGEDERVRAVLEAVPATRVGELFGMADAFVLARSQVWTSGSLILAVSLGVPVVAARLPPAVELLGDGEAGWLFTPGNADSLTQALHCAAADPAAAAEKRRAAQRRGGGLPGWPEVARQTAYAFEGRPSRHQGQPARPPLTVVNEPNAQAEPQAGPAA